MVFRTEDICIEEVSFEIYCHIKTRQFLKPPREAKNNTLYGKITQTISTTPERMSRDILESLLSFQRVKGLEAVREEEGNIFLRRFVVYSRDVFKNPSYSFPSNLSDIIKQGRGIDLILKGGSSKGSQEKHFYRSVGESLVLVQAYIPQYRWVHYKFRKQSGSGFTRLEAAFLMPDSLVQLERARRASS